MPNAQVGAAAPNKAGITILLGMLLHLQANTPKIKTYIGFRDQIFPFSENWPANYNFSLFSKLPTNYPKISEKL